MTLVKQIFQKQIGKIIVEKWLNLCWRNNLQNSNHQFNDRLFEIRKKLYELLAHCIPAQVILKTLVVYLLERSDETFKYKLVQDASHYVF